MKKVPAEAKHQARIDTFGGTWTQFDVFTLFRKKRFVLEKMTLVKCFKICHIFGIEKPQEVFFIFHVVLLEFFPQ